MTDEPERVVVEFPASPKDVVGGTLRPRRFLTLGRRRSDRLTFYALALVAVAGAIFTVVTSARLDGITHQLDQTYQICRRQP